MSAQIPFPELGKVPMGVAADNVAGVEYRLVQIGTEYKGLWDPVTNIPSLSDATGSNGEWYRISQTGTRDLGSGPVVWAIHDSAIHNGTIWQHEESRDTVTSVNGKIGDVIVNKADVGLGNADNTSDIDKPVSSAQQAEIDTKEDWLDTPIADGWVVSSSITGTRSWIPMAVGLDGDQNVDGGRADTIYQSTILVDGGGA